MIRGATMRVPQRRRVVRSLVLLGLSVLLTSNMARAQSETTPRPPQPQAPPPLDGPATDLAPIPHGPDTPQARTVPADDQGPPPTPGTTSPTDEVVDSGRVRVSQPPPAPIVERPSGPRPDRRAQWIAGHWSWDASREIYVWVGGSWQVPPEGSTWVAGRWLHDAAGWYWIPGTWRGPRDGSIGTGNRAAWRTIGPPAKHPDDTPPPAPGPDVFFVPGHYAPAVGDRLVWTPGFWARVQAGWEWIPARWIQRANGWDFREGRWVRDPETIVADSGPRGRRRVAARPLFPGRRPPVEDSQFSGDRPPPPPVPEAGRDPIAEAEEANRAIPRVEGPEVIVGPGDRMPYYVIRPPGAYPYGLGGVVVPGAVPPFVRRLLDRVLP
jgi:hypothetical protein